MDLTKILVDPLDQSQLTFMRDDNGNLSGIHSKSSTYRVTNGIPDLIPDPLPSLIAERKALWDKLQDNGNFAYSADSTLNLTTDDEFAKVFQQSTGLCGKVLDIGCGPQVHSPRYLDSPGIGPVVGVDPLEGAEKRDFPFIMGISEALPFPDQSFDHVVFCRSLDHVLDTKMALEEAMRVARSGGSLCVVMDLVATERQNFITKLGHLAFRGVRQIVGSARRQGIFHAVRYIWTIVTLKVPEGAEDMFHMHFPSPEEVRGILEHAGASTVRFHNISDDETICIAKKS